jgi:hypothetical protein
MQTFSPGLPTSPPASTKGIIVNRNPIVTKIIVFMDVPPLVFV